MLAARVVMPYTALGSAGAGDPARTSTTSAPASAPPRPPRPRRPTSPQPNIAEIYEQLKIPDDVAVGAYANTLMISHTASEFCLDFILDLFPRPTVTQRVYMSAAADPRAS